MQIHDEHHHKSAGLATIADVLLKHKGTVLDLGALSSGTTTAFLKKGCKCFVEDIAEIIPLGQKDIDHFENTLKDHLLPKPKDLKFDAVLCWDLLNYLSLLDIKTLFNVLAPHFKKGTILHMMQYTGITIPARPRHFKLLNNFNFKIASHDEKQTVSAFGHTTITLLKSMNKFDLKYSHINQSGMHKKVKEMILTYGTLNDRSQVKHSTHSQNNLLFSQKKHTIKCPALIHLIDQKSYMKKQTVLDLGSRSGRDLHFINSLCHKLYIEDIHSSIRWQKKLDNTTEMPLSAHTLRLNEPHKIDIVLAWDIFNYCSLAHIKDLGELMAKKIPPKGLLHFIIYKEQRIPDKPAKFTLDDLTTVSVTGEITGNNHRAFTYTASLMKLLPQFSIELFHYGNFNNNEGYQEFLLKKN